MRKKLRQAVLLGCVLTGLGVAEFFAFPYTNSYLAAPGLMVAWIINGGVHGSGLGKWFGVWFWVIAVGVNMLLYSLCSLAIITAIGLAKRKSSPVVKPIA